MGYIMIKQLKSAKYKVRLAVHTPSQLQHHKLLCLGKIAWTLFSTH